MSSSEVVLRAQTRITCDKCGRVEVSAEYEGYDYSAPAYLRNRLIGDGWRLYASRSLRHYCPNCSPTQGHRMRLIAGGEPR